MQFSLRRQWRLVGGLTADQISTDRHQRLATLRPQRGDDRRGSRPPVKAADRGLFDLEGIHQIDHVKAQYGLLPVAHGLGRSEARGAIAAQVRNDDTEAFRRQDRSNFGERMNVVWPAVQKNDHRAGSRTDLDIANTKGTGVDLLNRPKSACLRCPPWLGLGLRLANQAELRHRKCCRGGAEKKAALLADVIDHHMLSGC